MKPILKIELTRAFGGKNFLLSIGIGTLISLVYFFRCVLPCAFSLPQLASIGFDGELNGAYPGLLYCTWMGGTPLLRAEIQLYFLILPVLAALPFADSYFSDLRSGFIQNVCIRINRKHYFTAKYIATFLSGGTAGTFPLLLNFLLSAMVLPSMKPEVYTMYSNISQYSTFPWLYYNHPMLYIALYLTIIFIFSGLLACFGLYATQHLGYAFLVLFAPMALYLFVSSALNLIARVELAAWQPIRFLQPSFSQSDAKLPMLIESFVLFALTFIGFKIRQSRKDILN